MASIADIAKKLNLSNSTVSRALRDSGLVTKETREKVLLAAQEVGYEVNVIARKLRSGESKTIGVIVSDITNLFHGEIITAIQKVAIDNGYTVIFGTSSEDENTERELIDLLKSNMLQGLIIVPTHQSINNIRPLAHLPIVEVDRLSGLDSSDQVLISNHESMKLATNYLISQGHRNILYCTGDLAITTFDERLSGFKSAIAEADSNITHDVLLVKDTDKLQARTSSEVINFLTGKNRPSAIIAANDFIGEGVISAIYKCGLAVPEDISFLMFDDPRWASFFPTPLTVIKQPAYQLGLTAAKLLISKIENKEKRTKSVKRLTADLIVRQSVAKVG
ncbi:MAG: LacI family DNA-binding transcriptional regulator [Klebsiella huaxiensis]|uniref:LacI family DNA-binding transcriptional regulator n=1 Tax=Klebsiella huaxiensis TaxID=2153354 RepID=UPI0026F183ED|nr:LacI family DNA-binding transcriptional regulator [Klebsiella huaxiensis]WEJ86966.1 MAG: LacI family DNA-binding transcriptional regulator [Klebsiella huaxiensis]